MDTTQEVKPKKKRRLTQKQQDWMRAYIETGNKTEASRIAKYNIGSKGGKTDSESESNTLSHIGQENFQKLTDEIDAEYERLGKIPLTAEFIIGGLRQIARESDKDSNRISAFELLGKSKALFTDKSETINKTMQITQEITAPFAEKSPNETTARDIQSDNAI